jgi:hypothetical protein
MYVIKDSGDNMYYTGTGANAIARTLAELFWKRSTAEKQAKILSARTGRKWTVISAF